MLNYAQVNQVGEPASQSSSIKQPVKSKDDNIQRVDPHQEEGKD